MALRFRVRGPNGSQKVLDPLQSSSTMEQLQSAIIKALELVNVLPSCLQIKFIYPPPKVISEVAPNTTLKSLQLTSGNLIVSVLDTPFIDAEQQHQAVKPMKEQKEQKHDSPKQANICPIASDGTMVVKQIPSDNSCLFNSVLFLMEDEQTASELREVIASIVMSSPQQYNAALLGKSNGQYIEYILKPNTWGGAIEISILSTYFEVQINAIDVVSLQIHRFGEGQHFKECIYVIYDGIHYDALMMKPSNENKANGSNIYRFKTSDDSVMAQALSIAAERNQNKQFTDVYNFALVCNVCGTKLKGQSEAQKHAESTGHQSFSQYQ